MILGKFVLVVVAIIFVAWLIGGVMRGRTTIVITHRPELARRADRVLTLSGARIVEPVF